VGLYIKDLRLDNNLSFKALGGLAYFQIMKCHGLPLRVASVAVPGYDSRAQVVHLELINVEPLTDKPMSLFQLQGFIQPVHQQRLAVYSFNFDLSRDRRCRSRSQSIEHSHAMRSILEHLCHVMTRDAKSAIGRVLDFFKTHR